MLALSLAFGLSLHAQSPEPPQRHSGQQMQRPPQRPSAYDLADETRKALSLDTKQFEKTLSAYEKYNKNVFGDEPAQQGRPEGGRPPMGGPGGFGGPGPGGMHPGGHGGPGGPGGMRPGNPEGQVRPSANFDPEKMEKAKAKAEKDLDKAMKKLFKKSPEKYGLWLELRDEQLKRIFPQPPHRMDKDEKPNAGKL
ncbi:MAG: hypothetical protein NC102_05775 [Clostridium sp.]|nr:hypothetical protein [Clostridium sp.]